MPVRKEELIRKYVNALREGNAAVFAGAGLSRPSGYVDWKGLLRPLATDINLDIDKENDLLAVAQFYRNRRGSRTQISQAILDAFSKDTQTNENVQILTRLPIFTYWTTNYDELLEKGIEEANRKPDVKSEQDQLSIVKTDRDAVVYKMHGDVNRPATAVLTKSDYETYENKRSLFRTALKGDLISKKFLFIGFSFADPNLDYILSQIRVLLNDEVPEHFCFFKRVQRSDYTSPEDYGYACAKQDMQEENLRNYGIQTVFVDSYDEITDILEQIERLYKMKKVFISGSVGEYCPPWNEERTQDLASQLARALVYENNRIYSGYGSCIGSAVINGALDVIYSQKYRHVDEYLCLRPFPRCISDPKERANKWEQYRESIISETGISIFMFGNKIDEKTGLTINSAGCLQEYEIAKKKGNIIIPIGSTGFASKAIFEDVRNHLSEYPYLNDYIDLLGHETDVKTIVDTVIKIIKNYE